MALRKEITKKQGIELVDVPNPDGSGEILKREQLVDINVHEVVFDLRCEVCQAITGEARFPAAHGRESDDHLEAELKAKYVSRCDAHPRA